MPPQQLNHLGRLRLVQLSFFDLSFFLAKTGPDAGISFAKLVPLAFGNDQGAHSKHAGADAGFSGRSSFVDEDVHTQS